jgi:hypothetical protein
MLDFLDEEILELEDEDKRGAVEVFVVREDFEMKEEEDNGLRKVREGRKFGLEKPEVIKSLAELIRLLLLPQSNFLDELEFSILI